MKYFEISFKEIGMEKLGITMNMLHKISDKFTIKMLIWIDSTAITLTALLSLVSYHSNKF
jgi:hypothetical protein